MKHFITLLVCLASTLEPCQAGDIIGTVRAEGKQGAEGGLVNGKYTSRKFKFVQRIDYDQLQDFVVYIDQPPSTKPTPPTRPAQVVTRKVTQKGATFSPRVLPVMVGTTVQWPNKDDIFHNVFSISEAKPFDLGLYKDPEVKQVNFNKAGRVEVFCSIHSAMNCTVLVLETPHFAATQREGRYAITNVPPGVYPLRAWHERLPSQVKEVTVPATGSVQVDFTLGIVNLPKY